MQGVIDDAGDEPEGEHGERGVEEVARQGAVVEVGKGGHAPEPGKGAGEKAAHAPFKDAARGAVGQKRGEDEDGDERPHDFERVQGDEDERDEVAFADAEFDRVVGVDEEGEFVSLEVDLVQDFRQPAAGGVMPLGNAGDNEGDEGVVGEEEAAAFAQAAAPVAAARPEEEQQREAACPEGGDGDEEYGGPGGRRPGGEGEVDVVFVVGKEEVKAGEPEDKHRLEATDLQADVVVFGVEVEQEEEEEGGLRADADEARQAAVEPKREG